MAITDELAVGASTGQAGPGGGGGATAGEPVEDILVMEHIGSWTWGAIQFDQTTTLQTTTIQAPTLADGEFLVVISKEAATYDGPVFLAHDWIDDIQNFVSTAIDLTDGARTAVRAGWGQNDWLYLGLDNTDPRLIRLCLSDNIYVDSSFQFYHLRHVDIRPAVPPGQQAPGAGGGGAISFADIITDAADSVNLTETPTSVVLSTLASDRWNIINFEQVDLDKLIGINILISSGNRFTVPFYLTRHMLRKMGAYNGDNWHNDWNSGNERIPAAYASFDYVSSGVKDPMFIRPSYFQAETRRSQGQSAFFVFWRSQVVDQTTYISGISIVASTGLSATLEGLELIWQED